MANSVTVSVTAQVIMGDLTITFSSASTSAPTSNAPLATRQTLPIISGGTAEALIKGETATIETLIVKNNDVTNSVTLYAAATIAGAAVFATIKPGVTNVISVNVANVYAAIALVAGDVTFVIIPADA